MTVPFRLKFFGIDVDTQVALDTANKIAIGMAGVAAGTAVIAAGAAIGNANVIKVGGGIAAAGALGTVAAIGLKALPPAADPPPQA